MNATKSRTLWLTLGAAGSVAAAFAIYRWRRNGMRSARPRLTEDRGNLAIWRFDRRFVNLPAGKVMRIELSTPAIVHWSTNQWDAVQDTRTTEIAPGVHAADLNTENLAPDTRLQFTFYWPQASRWEGEDFEVRIEYAKQYAT